MKLIKLFLILFITFSLISCSKDKVQKSTIKQKSLELQVLEAYEEGMESLKKMMSCMQQKNLMKLKHSFHNLQQRQKQL